MFLEFGAKIVNFCFFHEVNDFTVRESDVNRLVIPLPCTHLFHFCIALRARGL